MKRLLRPFLNNEASTDGSWWYPDLEPRKYELPPEEVLDAIRQVVALHPRWTFHRADEDELTVDFEARTPTVGWVDDVHVWLEIAEDDRTLVHARSSSRVGTGDFEANARRIRKFFEKLDRRLL